MNHLICFEEMKSTLEYIYNVGNYIFLGGEGWNVGPKCKIIRIYHDEIIGNDGITRYDIGYQIFGYDKRDDVYNKFWDFENFELKKTTNKYNI